MRAQLACTSAAHRTQRTCTAGLAVLCAVVFGRHEPPRHRARGGGRRGARGAPGRFRIMIMLLVLEQCTFRALCAPEFTFRWGWPPLPALPLAPRHHSCTARPLARRGAGLTCPAAASGWGLQRLGGQGHPPPPPAAAAAAAARGWGEAAGGAGKGSNRQGGQRWGQRVQSRSPGSQREGCARRGGAVPPPPRRRPRASGA